MIGFTGWSVTRATAATGFSAPDGSTNTTQLTDDQSASTTHSVSTNATSAANTTYVFSAYVKAGTLSWVRLQSGHDSTATYAFFNLSGTGAVGVLSSDNPSAWIQQLSNGWYRCSMAVAMTAAATNSFVLYLSPINNNFGYTGTGTGTTYFWGAQVEAGAFPTSYIPTSGSAVTRQPDAFTVPTSATGANGAWYTQGVGTLIGYEIIPYLGSSAYNGFVAIDDNTLNNVIDMNFNQAAVSQRAEIKNSGTFTYGANLFSPPYVAGAVNKGALAFQTNNVRSAFNGNLLALGTSASIPTSVTQLNIGRAGGPYNSLDGWEWRITYFPTRQPDYSLPDYTR